MILAEKTFADCSLLPCQRMPCFQISRRKLLQIATKPRNSRNFLHRKFLAIYTIVLSPDQIFHRPVNQRSYNQDKITCTLQSDDACSVKLSDSMHCSLYWVLFCAFLRVVCHAKAKTCTLLHVPMVMFNVIYFTWAISLGVTTCRYTCIIKSQFL